MGPLVQLNDTVAEGRTIGKSIRPQSRRARLKRRVRGRGSWVLTPAAFASPSKKGRSTPSVCVRLADAIPATRIAGGSWALAFVAAPTAASALERTSKRARSLLRPAVVSMGENVRTRRALTIFILQPLKLNAWDGSLRNTKINARGRLPVPIDAKRCRIGTRRTRGGRRRSHRALSTGRFALPHSQRTLRQIVEFPGTASQAIFGKQMP